MVPGIKDKKFCNKSIFIEIIAKFLIGTKFACLNPVDVDHGQAKFLIF
jgi:hypothetical protein